MRQLTPIADDGAPTVAELQTSFEAAKGRAEAALSGGGEGLSWLNRAFGDAVSVRRIDGEDSDPQAILARAEETLAAGEIAEALALVERLDGAPASEMADWTEQANRRITLETALESLQQRLLEGNNSAP